MDPHAQNSVNQERKGLVREDQIAFTGLLLHA